MKVCRNENRLVFRKKVPLFYTTICEKVLLSYLKPQTCFLINFLLNRMFVLSKLKKFYFVERNILALLQRIINAIFADSSINLSFSQFCKDKNDDSQYSDNDKNTNPNSEFKNSSNYFATCKAD